MISVALEKRVRSLLAEGTLSQRSIARLTGLSRSSIGGIARGNRRAFIAAGVDDGVKFFSTSQSPQRCPECGGLVYMPCHACRIRGYVSLSSNRSGASNEATSHSAAS
jgi:hypothetical protein